MKKWIEKHPDLWEFILFNFDLSISPFAQIKNP